MFTGIVQTAGRIAAVETGPGDRRLRIGAHADFIADLVQGDSIAISGVCLTVVKSTGEDFAVDVSAETLACTTLRDLQAGDAVNLERALILTAPLSGHLVTGHIDGVGVVTRREADGRSTRLTVEAPESLARYIAVKGSICIDGVSLTVNRANGCAFEVNIIPHTLQVTTINDYAAGTRVNLEVDIIARYLERLLSGRMPDD